MQNKNRMIVFLLMFLVANGVYDRIDHTFLVSGHSFLPSGRDITLIEMPKKVFLLVPEDLKRLIPRASGNQTFHVVTMQGKDFLDVQKAADAFYKHIYSKPNVSSTVWMEISSQKPAGVRIKHTFSEIEEWTCYGI